MKKTKYIVLAAAMLAATGVNAGTTGKTVTGAGCDQAGTCWVNISPALDAADTACTNKVQIRWNIADVSGKSWLATGLTAKAAEITVNVGLVPGVCSGTFAQLNFLTAQ